MGRTGDYGGQGRNRTTDTRIFSPLLYRLSYLATLLHIKPGSYGPKQHAAGPDTRILVGPGLQNSLAWQISLPGNNKCVFSGLGSTNIGTRPFVQMWPGIMATHCELMKAAHYSEPIVKV